MTGCTGRYKWVHCGLWTEEVRPVTKLHVARGPGSANPPRQEGQTPFPAWGCPLRSLQYGCVNHEHVFLNCPWGCWGSQGYSGSAGGLCLLRQMVPSFPCHGACGAQPPPPLFSSCSGLSPWQGNECFPVQSLCYGPERKQPITENKMDTSQAGAPKFLQ